MRTGGAALGLGAGAMLAGCSNTTSAATGGSAANQGLGPGGLPLARPDKRVSLPIYEDNQPIAGGLEPETGGTFTIYNFPEYFDPSLLKKFGRQYGVTVVVTPFDDITSGVARLASGAVSADVTNMSPDHLDAVVAGKLVQPLNLEYVPNLAKNVWPALVSPFYDVGSNYGVPYTVYKTGVAWRTDAVKRDVAGMANPWNIFWEAQPYSGRTGVLNGIREAIVLALLRQGHLDINTEDPALVNGAVSDLKELYRICNVKVGDVQYESLPENKSWLNQAYNGDMLAAVFYYLPNKEAGSVLRYWSAPPGKASVQNDMWCICKGTKKPVLAHLFLNFLLDNGNAYQNFVNFNGFQPPLSEINSADLVKQGLIPETLANCVMTADELGPNSLQEMTLSVPGQQLWTTAYSEFLAG